MSNPGAKRRVLGRGIEALLGQVSAEEAEREGSLRELLVGEIKANRYQPRRAFDPAELKDLKESLAANGLLQPIVVRPSESGYELVAGERRWRAAKDLGWKRIPAVVREVDDQTLLTLALVENLQRASLSPIDEAEGYERLAREFKRSHAEIASAVGRDRSTVANAVRLLQLPKSVQQLLDAGALTAGHARALLSLEDGRAQLQLARQAVAHGWSVRDVEQRTRGGVGSKSPKAAKATRAVSPETRRIEDALRKKLGTDVAVVVRGRQQGHVAVRFYSNDDLVRLLELLLGRRWDG